MLSKVFSLFSESTESFKGQYQGEVLVMLLRRHKYTIVTPLSILALLALAPLVFWNVLSAHFASPLDRSILEFLVSIWYLVWWIAAFYFIMLYSLNTLIITDRRIIDNNQIGLFDRKVSELNLYRIQDVSVEVKGVMETFLRFGDIVIETAAKDEDFRFKEIADPERVKNVIMQALSSHQEKTGLS